MAGTAPQKRPPRKAAPVNLAGPPNVTLDLDALDKADVVANAVTEPFTFRHDGHVYTMSDPRDMDWRELLQGMRNPAMFMAHAMEADEDKNKFLSTRLPGWKLNAIFENWQTHYGVTGLGDLSALLGS